MNELVADVPTSKALAMFRKASMFVALLRVNSAL